MKRTSRIFFGLSLAAISCLAEGLEFHSGSQNINLNSISYINNQASGDINYMFEGDDEDQPMLANLLGNEDAKSATLSVNNINIENSSGDLSAALIYMEELNNGGTNATTNLKTLNVKNSNFGWLGGAEAYILDSDTTGHKTNAALQSAFLDTVIAKEIILSQSANEVSGDASATLGKANANNSEFGAFIGANAEADVNGNSTANLTDQLWFKDVKLNNGLFASRATADGDASATSNKVFLQGISGNLENFIDEEDDDLGAGIYGSYAEVERPKGNATAKTNYMEISGGSNIKLAGGNYGIYGSYALAENDKATASTGTFIIDSNKNLYAETGIYGSYAQGGKNGGSAITDKMFISNSKIGGDGVIGSYADGNNGNATAKTNALYILDNVQIDGDVTGAYAEDIKSDANAWVALIGSKENRDKNSIKDDVTGAEAYTWSSGGTATANRNSIFIENFSIGGDIYGGRASTHLLDTTTYANNNSIFLGDGTTIGGNVYGGYIEGGKGEAKNNTVTISGEVKFDKDSQIWGGYAKNYNGTQDVYTGNTLNFFGTKGIIVDTIGNFENYNFNLANQDVTNLKKEENSLITTNNIINQNEKTSTVNIAMSLNQYNAINGDTIYLVNNKGGEIEAQMGTARVGMFYRTNADLKADENGVWSATIGTNGTNNEGQNELNKNPNGVVPSEDDVLNGFTNSGNSINSESALDDAKQNPNGGNGGLEVNTSDLKRLRPINEARLESLMLANVNADLANQAISDLRVSNFGDITPFGVISGGHTKYKTGSKSNIKSNDFNFVVGTRYNFDNTIAGWFFEYGRGKYDSKNKFKADNENDALSVKGKGTNYNYGIGLFTKTYINSAYIDTAAHLGRAKIDFNTNSYTKNGYAFNPNYNHDVSYFGGHVGAGYVAGLDSDNSFDTSVKYLYNQVNGKNQTINEDRFKFKKEVSNRLQVGEQYKFKANEYVALKAGATYEYEFSAKAKSNVVDAISGDKHKIGAAKLKGSTYIGELGFEVTPFSDKKNSSIDFNAKGYGGKKEGASGNVAFKYSF